MPDSTKKYAPARLVLARFSPRRLARPLALLIVGRGVAGDVAVLPERARVAHAAAREKLGDDDLVERVLPQDGGARMLDGKPRALGPRTPAFLLPARER